LRQQAGACEASIAAIDGIFRIKALRPAKAEDVGQVKMGRTDWHNLPSTANSQDAGDPVGAGLVAGIARPGGNGDWAFLASFPLPTSAHGDQAISANCLDTVRFKVDFFTFCGVETGLFGWGGRWCDLTGGLACGERLSGCGRSAARARRNSSARTKKIFCFWLVYAAIVATLEYTKLGAIE